MTGSDRPLDRGASSLGAAGGGSSGGRPLDRGASSLGAAGGREPDTRWLDAEEQRAWRAYLDATRLLIRALDQQLQSDAEVSFTDYELLVKLSEAPGQRLRMRDLADATMSTRSGVTRAVTRLEQIGWVRRVECEDDRRGTHAELTPAGAAKLAAAAPGHVAAVRAHLFDQLTPAQVNQVGAAFGRVAEVLQRPGNTSTRHADVGSMVD